MLALVGEAHHLVQHGQARRALEVYRLYCSIEQQCGQEPIASSYDHGLMLFGALFGEYSSNLRRWDHAYRCCAAVLRQLAVTNRRRAAAGYKELPHSELRWIVLRILADCKWQQDESERDRLLAPAPVVAEFWRIHAAVRPRLVNDEWRALPRKENTIKSLDWCHLAVCKLAYRYLRDSEYFDLAMKFNRGQDYPTLAIGEGHWRGCELKGRRLFYLDFEIAKSFLSGTLSAAELDALNERRRGALKEEGDSATPLYLATLKAEHEWMRVHCRRLEVVSA